MINVYIVYSMYVYIVYIPYFTDLIGKFHIKTLHSSQHNILCYDNTPSILKRVIRGYELKRRLIEKGMYLNQCTLKKTETSKWVNY